MPAGWPIRRYLLVLVLALALPMLGLLVHSLHESHRQALADAERNAAQVAALIVADTRRYVADSRTVLEGLAERPLVRAADPARCDPVLAELRPLFAYLANVAVADADGRIVCSGLPLRADAPRSVAGADWFADVRRERRFIAGKAHVGPISGRWVTVMAQPLTDEAGGFGGVIGFALDLARLDPIPAGIDAERGLVVYLVDGNDTIISRSEAPAEWIGKPMADAEALALTHGDEQPGAAFVGAADARRLVGHAHIPGTGWRVVTVQPARLLADSLWRRTAGKYLVAALVILLAAALAFHVGRRIVRPMSSIARTARSIADGNLGLRAPVDGPAEMRTVASQFNAMLDIRQKTEERYRNLLESAADAILVTDAAGRIIIANRMASQQFGYSREEMLGRPVEMLVPDEFREMHVGQREGYVAAARLRQRIVQAQRKDGSRFPCEVGLSPLHTDDGLIVSVFVRDLSERIRFQEKLDQLSRYDTLTGLPNRSLLRDRLEQALGRAERSGGQVAVVCLDVDGFTEINNFHGHVAADWLLREIATRARAALREVDTLARAGSDEFVAIVESAAGESVAQEVAERLYRALREPVQIAGSEIVPTASFGIAVFPQDARDPDDLIKCADLAMEQAQRQGGDAYCFFEMALDLRAGERRRLLERLRGALARGEFLLHYQPQVATGSGRMLGVEALLRWQSPELGMVAPDRFIPLAEESGLIDAIGDWVLQTACTQAMDWRRQGVVLTVAVNLSARQFRQADLAARVRKALDRSGLDAGGLELEITEGMLMDDPERAAAVLQELDRMGVRISVDDFGTGYSSLSYLKRFPVSELKIDRSFVRDTPADADDVAIVSAVVGLAHNLRLGVVAEGVETREQHEFLASIGCEICQGYLFSRPVQADDIPRLAARE